MNEPSSDRRAWINQWEKTRPLLDAQAQIELRRMSIRKRQQQIENLLELASEFWQPRTDDGLIKLKQAFSEMFGNE